jgi:hypothetical protein
MLLVLWVPFGCMNLTSCATRATTGPGALGLGLPLLLLVCRLLPAGILWVALRNRQRLNDPMFMCHYGFLVRSYKPAYC